MCTFIAWKGHPRNDLYCAEWDIKLYSLTHWLSLSILEKLWTNFGRIFWRGRAWLWAQLDLISLVIEMWKRMLDHITQQQKQYMQPQRIIPIVFGRTYVLAQMFYLFIFEREISEMRGPTGVKFCTMVSTRPNFIMPVRNFGGTPPKNFGGEKHAKFGPISDDFEVRRRISAKRMKIFKIGFLLRLPRFLLR